MPGGLPHSETPGSPIARISPGLFAACCVLHRLSVPRHPPDALLYSIARRLSQDAPRPERSKSGSHPRLARRPSMKTLPDTHAHPFRGRRHARLGHITTLSSPLNQHFAPGGPPHGRIPYLRRVRDPWRVPRPPPGAAAGASGGDRARTDALLLAKQALSQLSYTPGQRSPRIAAAPRAEAEWAREDLNLRPHAYQARALTS